VTIALYAPSPAVRYAVIDDRRWVDVDGDTLVLDRVDPGAALPSLLIEPLTGPLRIGACLRDRIAMPLPDAPPLPPESGGAATEPPGDGVVPMLRCRVAAPPGRYLVRLLYLSSALGYRAQHDVTVTAPDRATVTSRFAIATPAWRTRAELTLFEGAPGGDPPPRELVRGSVALDGGTAVIAIPPREVTARMLRIYDGAVRRPDGPEPRDPRWGRDSHSAVWVWLELGGLGERRAVASAPASGAAPILAPSVAATASSLAPRAASGLAPGPVHVHVELPGEAIRDIDVPAGGRRAGPTALSLPLWIDDRLRGKRDRWSDSPEDALLTERFLVSVANSGDTPREVWIEELLRPAPRHSVSHAWPRAPEVDHRRLRMKLTVAPGTVERAGFAVDYER
jgi:hypothetical protein